MSDNCGQDGVCAEAPGCSRHWAERVCEVMAERDAALAATVNAALIHADLVRERDEARAALGEAWMTGGVSLADGIRRKTAALEKLR